MVIVAAGEHLDMQGDLRVRCECAQELANVFGGKVAYPLTSKLNVVIEAASSADVEADQYERFVHWGGIVSVPLDPLLALEGLSKGLAKENSNVFGGVMIIYLDVAFGADAQVDLPVECKLGEDVVDVSVPGAAVLTRSTIQIEHDLNASFAGFPVELGVSHAGGWFRHK
jgi:hypothetical protein